MARSVNGCRPKASGIVLWFLTLTVLSFSHILWAGVDGAVVATDVVSKLELNGEIEAVIAFSVPNLPLSNRSLLNAKVSEQQSVVLDELSFESYEVIHQYRSVPGLVLRIRSMEALELLSNLPQVRRVDLDVGGQGTLAQSLPWINGDQAHSAGYNGAGMVAAVVDSGIDTDHPDLSDHLVHEHCICNTGINCCPTGGSVGDGPGSAEDDRGHGTHVSGIITSGGSVASLGIAPNAGIVAVKVLDSNGAFNSTSDITAALDWILNNRPDVNAINMSLGTWSLFSGDCDNVGAWSMNLAAAVNALRAAGVMSVVSSGNDSNSNSMGAPACLSQTIAVGATYDNADNIASFSNSGANLDILAPGVNITSSMIGGGTDTWQGTSMAAPHVTAAAVMLSEQNASLTVSDRVACLATSPTNILDTRNGLTRPRLDVASALAACDKGNTFYDVPMGHWAYSWIEQLVSAGITSGCDANNYCPDDPVTRASMAIFLERGIHGSGYIPPTANGTVFGDVSNTYWAASWIEQLSADGITGGCGGGNYCPGSNVTRAQMAVFLLRSKYGASYIPPLATGTMFDDVSASHWAAPWIEQLAKEGITSGCDANNYCPAAEVKRDQMAIFLVRAFNL